MPLYEYECQGCQRRFERYQRAWNEPVRCPSCDSAEVEKQLSRFAMGATALSGGGGGCGCGRGGCGCH